MRFGADVSRLSFTIVSDTHDHFPPISKFTDVLIHCGDITDEGGIESHRTAVEALIKAPAELKLIIPGNHDVDLDATFWSSEAEEASHGSQRDEQTNKRLQDEDAKPQLVIEGPQTSPDNSLSADDESAVITHDIPAAVKAAYTAYTSPTARAANIHLLKEGLYTFTLATGTSFNLYATPYTPAYGIADKGAFQYPTAHDRFNHPKITPVYAKNTGTMSSCIPDYPNVDVIVSHGPPAYVLDATERGGGAGCRHMLRAVSGARPLLHCFGHVHGARGIKRVEWRDPMRTEARVIGSKRKRDDSKSSQRQAPGSRLAGSLECRGDGEDLEFDELPREFIGENQARRAGVARVRAVEAAQQGRQTLFVNAALGNDADRDGRVPYMVEIQK